MTRWDRILVLAVLALALLSAPAAFALRRIPGDTVIVTAPPGTSEFPLSRDGVHRIQGARGELTLVIEGGDAYVSDADCPDGVCVDTGGVLHAGVIVCAPNSVAIRTTPRGEGYDALSR